MRPRCGKAHREARSEVADHSLHDDEAATLQMLDEAFSHDRRNELVGVVDALTGGNLTSGSALLVISDAAAQIADPGREAHLRNRRLVSAWPRKHVADLGYFTFRLLVPGVEFRAKRFAGRVLEGPRVHTDQLLGIGVANGDGLRRR